jgi:hypothetical protein
MAVSVRTGDITHRTRTYRCERCCRVVVVQGGTALGDCEGCANTRFTTGWVAFVAAAPSVRAAACRASVDCHFGKGAG